jgi:hypothetical protein
MTECTQSNFEFATHYQREVIARFDGGTMTSDGGALLLRETDQRLHLLTRFAQCFLDGRDPERVKHSLEEMVSQRVYGLALGYEDVNDHEQLRHDPLLAVLSGKREVGEESLAGKSTLNRLELGPEEKNRYRKISYQQEAIDELMTTIFLEAHPEALEQIVLDLDATDLPLHGHQEERFFHGYYDHYCYLPLYIFSGEHLLCARLRSASVDGAAGAAAEVERIVKQIRRKWCGVRIIVRADAGFCREELMDWCEHNQVDYVLGVSRNPRLERRIGKALQKARGRFAVTGEAARTFVEFYYRTRQSWSRRRRVVAKAEWLEKGANPRFIVTSLGPQEWHAPALYEQLYCERGEAENRIKEQLSLFADRVSAESMKANQLRVYFAGIAYVLMTGLRRLGLQGTTMARAQATTIRLRLLKIAARIRITARKVWLSMASSYPWQAVYGQVYAQLRGETQNCPA